MAEMKVYFVTELAANFGAGYVCSAKDGEGKAGSSVQGPGSANQGLQLVFTQPAVVIDGAIQFASKVQARGEIVCEREASGVDVAVCGLDPQNAGTGITGKKEAEVSNEPCLV